jgi:hypothetical protein
MEMLGDGGEMEKHLPSSPLISPSPNRFHFISFIR